MAEATKSSFHRLLKQSNTMDTIKKFSKRRSEGYPSSKSLAAGKYNRSNMSNDAHHSPRLRRHQHQRSRFLSSNGGGRCCRGYMPSIFAATIMVGLIQFARFYMKLALQHHQAAFVMSSPVQQALQEQRQKVFALQQQQHDEKSLEPKTSTAEPQLDNQKPQNRVDDVSNKSELALSKARNLGKNNSTTPTEVHSFSTNQTFSNKITNQFLQKAKQEEGRLSLNKGTVQQKSVEAKQSRDVTKRDSTNNNDRGGITDVSTSTSTTGSTTTTAAVTALAASSSLTSTAWTPRKNSKFKYERSMPDPPPITLNNESIAADELPEPADILLLDDDMTTKLQQYSRPLAEFQRNHTTKFQSQVKYLGVLLDAGRFHFDVSWIKRLIDIMSLLNFNLLHFRLTDDQTFNIQLGQDNSDESSLQQLAYPAPSVETITSRTRTSFTGKKSRVLQVKNRTTYTPSQLRELVSYAKHRNVTIVPEINVPGHAGAWAGIPNMIVQCPNFICKYGYGIPLNVENSRLRSILTNLLREIISIFDNPPFIHLGGDEVHMAEECLEEVHVEPFNYTKFEVLLKEILRDIGYPEQHVIRWETTGQKDVDLRAGGITHYWNNVPGEFKRIQTTGPFFASAGLYFDTNGQEMAWQIFLNTRRYMYLLDELYPTGIVAGTFELDTNLWYDRNVIGRLLAVSIGASNLNISDGNELYKVYEEACRWVGFEDSLCQRYGKPISDEQFYKSQSRQLRQAWSKSLCQRLTYETTKRVFPIDKNQEIHRENAITKGGDQFWRHFGTHINETIEPPMLNTYKYSPVATVLPFRNRLVDYAGVILDVAASKPTQLRILDIIHNDVHPLSLNLVQLPIVNDYGFVARLRTLSGLTEKRKYSLSTHALKSLLVAKVAKLGIQVMPEISISTNAGGWHHSGLTAKCPVTLCDRGKDIPLDINDPLLLPVAVAAIRDILDIFSSDYIHLGTDERQKSLPCFKEAWIQPDFDSFERKLTTLLQLERISTDRIIRWENKEHTHYPGRVGAVTQCRPGSYKCPQNQTTTQKPSWFATVSLAEGGPWKIYEMTRELALMKPIGIVANIPNMDKDYFATHNIPQRLLAFAMGIASDLPSMDRLTFEKRYVDICNLRFAPTDVGCAAFASSDDGIDEMLPWESIEYRQSNCDSKTVVGNVTAYRDYVKPYYKL